MWQLSFIRIYLPLEKIPQRVHHLALRADQQTRQEIEAQASRQLQNRITAKQFTAGPRSSPPVVRVLEAKGPGGLPRRFYNIEYLERAAFDSARLRPCLLDAQLYERLVPQEEIDLLANISEVQADAGLIKRSRPTFAFQPWNVPLHWLVSFLELPDQTHNEAVTETIENGARIIRRSRDIRAAIQRLSRAHMLLSYYGSGGPNHPWTNSIARMQQWLNSFRIISHYQGMIELDYGGLTNYAWPDQAGTYLAEGFKVLEHLYQCDQEFETNNPIYHTGLPKTMLAQGAKYMAAKFAAAQEVTRNLSMSQSLN